MKYFLIALTIQVCSFAASAQTAEDSVKQVITQLFTAMKNADTTLLKTCFADSMVLQTIIRDKSGSAVVLNEKAAGFINSIGKLPAGAADEQIQFETIRIDGPLAIVWTPYKFYFNGKFSHCGANSFQLVRFKEGWKIQYLIDTRRRVGCGN